MISLQSTFSHINLMDKASGKPKWDKPHAHEEIIASPPMLVSTYDELIRLNAQISFRNRNLTLFYRGQGRDYKEKNATVLLPSIYRKKRDEKYLPLKDRFKTLDTYALELKDALQKRKEKFAGTILLNKYPEVTWSILQHYEICETPLIDLTHSLHVACSFAFLNNETDSGIIYVLGMPFVNDAIGYSTYEELVNIRLLSVCPPQATRPFFQEGYLAGPFPNFRLDDPARRNQFDFARRLIAKFEIQKTNQFWGDGFSKIPTDKLYPQNDEMKKQCETLKTAVNTNR